MSRFLVPGIAMLLVLCGAGRVQSQARVVVKEFVVITVDRASVRTDVPVINVEGQTLVPVRPVFAAFGAEIGWFPGEQQVYIRQDSKAIWLGIGKTHARINDDIVPLEVAARLYRGRTMVPLRFIAEALGASVSWNAGTQTITILTGRSGSAPPPD